jgi:hypothetical protein
MAPGSPERQLAGFLARYRPDVARVARGARAKVRSLLPGALELVYDNYNALAIGYGPSERASDAIVSIAVYPRWVSLFLLRGATLADPKGILKGAGRRVRHIVLDGPHTLDRADVRALVRAAIKQHPVRLDPSSRRRTIIKSVSAKQRPRRAGDPGGRRTRR